MNLNTIKKVVVNWIIYAKIMFYPVILSNNSLTLDNIIYYTAQPCPLRDMRVIVHFLRTDAVPVKNNSVPFAGTGEINSYLGPSLWFPVGIEYLHYHELFPIEAGMLD